MDSFNIQMQPAGTHNLPKFDGQGFFKESNVWMGDTRNINVQQPHQQLPIHNHPSMIPNPPAHFEHSQANHSQNYGMIHPAPPTNFQAQFPAQHLNVPDQTGVLAAPSVPHNVGGTHVEASQNGTSQVIEKDYTPEFTAIGRILGEMVRAAEDIENQGRCIREQQDLREASCRHPVLFADANKYALMAQAFESLKKAHNDLLPVALKVQSQMKDKDAEIARLEKELAGEDVEDDQPGTSHYPVEGHGGESSRRHDSNPVHPGLHDSGIFLDLGVNASIDPVLLDIDGGASSLPPFL